MASSTLQIKPTGFVITMLVGVIVTLLCAIAPAIRSGRIPPLAAMRDVSVDRGGDLAARGSPRGAVPGDRRVGIAVGLSGTTEMLGVGVVGLFIALIALGPLIAAPISRWRRPCCAPSAE